MSVKINDWHPDSTQDTIVTGETLMECKALSGVYVYCGDELLPHQVDYRIWVPYDRAQPIGLERGAEHPYRLNLCKEAQFKRLVHASVDVLVTDFNYDR